MCWWTARCAHLGLAIDPRPVLPEGGYPAMKYPGDGHPRGEGCGYRSDPGPRRPPRCLRLCRLRARRAIEDLHTLADPGYTGVDGIDLVPIERLAHHHLDTAQTEFNTMLSEIRASLEHAIAHLKTWRMLSEEDGRYRAPIDKYASMLRAITSLFFFSTYE